MGERERQHPPAHHHQMGYNHDAISAAPLPPVMHAPAPAMQAHSPYVYNNVRPPLQPQPPPQEYRVPTNGVHPVSLPPIQHFEPAPAPLGPHHQHQHHPTSIQPQQPRLPPQYAPPNGDPQYQHYGPVMQQPYRYPNGAVPSHNHVNGHGDLMQYNIAPHVPLHARGMAATGQHKKEIKRRTKTGCLTCRKRRIKCDESRPAPCKNCTKSKRECLGYEPPSKQNAGPTSIQPAPLPLASANMKTEQGVVPNAYPPPAYDGSGQVYANRRPPPLPHLPSNGSSTDSVPTQNHHVSQPPMNGHGGSQSYETMLKDARRGG